MSLRALPMIAVALILYNLMVMFSNGDADTFFRAPLVTIYMIKGAQWAFSRGDLIILVTMLCLFVELVKSTYTSTASLVDQGDRKSTRLNSSHRSLSRMPSSA